MISYLAYLYEQLRRKKEELARLQSCQSALIACQGDFFSNEPFCLLPELSNVTWHGQLASQFERIRHHEILLNYQDIESHQMNRSLQVLSMKIEETKREIALLEIAIQQELARLRESASSKRM